MTFIQDLLEHGADINHTLSCPTSVCRALARRDANILRLLLESGGSLGACKCTTQAALSGSVGASPAPLLDLEIQNIVPPRVLPDAKLWFAILSNAIEDHDNNTLELMLDFRAHEIGKADRSKLRAKAASEHNEQASRYLSCRLPP